MNTSISSDRRIAEMRQSTNRMQACGLVLGLDDWKLLYDQQISQTAAAAVATLTAANLASNAATTALQPKSNTAIAANIGGNAQGSAAGSIQAPPPLAAPSPANNVQSVAPNGWGMISVTNNNERVPFHRWPYLMISSSENLFYSVASGEQ